MRAITGADVLIHHRDAPWLRAGRVPAAGRSGALGRAVDVLPLLHWTPVAPDIELTGGETIAGLRVIHTPGHSPGHIALLHEATQTLLVGDAVFNRNDKVAVGPDAFAADPTTRTESLELLNLDVAAVGFAHGTPLTGAAVDQFAAYCEQSRAFTVEGQRGEPYSR
jgi:glyoxylase-like metal-dependent hydrolase (beta-lactamase superfamily II)